MLNVLQSVVLHSASEHLFSSQTLSSATDRMRTLIPDRSPYNWHNEPTNRYIYLLLHTNHDARWILKSVRPPDTNSLLPRNFTNQFTCTHYRLLALNSPPAGWFSFTHTTPLNFLQCFDTVGLVTRGQPALKSQLQLSSMLFLFCGTRPNLK